MSFELLAKKDSNSELLKAGPDRLRKQWGDYYLPSDELAADANQLPIPLKDRHEIAKLVEIDNKMDVIISKLNALNISRRKWYHLSH